MTNPPTTSNPNPSGSDSASGSYATPAVAGLAGLGAMKAPRSELARALLTTFGPKLAKLAGCWIALIGFAAVFAPLIASSHPYVLKVKGESWSSPLWQHLSFTDGLLLLLTLAGGVIFFVFRHKSVAVRLGYVLIVLFILAPACFFLFRPPQLVVYDRYRQLQKAGQVEFIVHAPIAFSPSDRLRDQFDPNDFHPRRPSASHWLGTEINGADVLSRLLHACRTAIAVGFVTTSIAVLIGIVLGGLMGYFSGVTDLIGMRLVEIFSAIPTFFLILSAIAFWGSGTHTLFIIMVILGCVNWPGYALFLRAEFLKLRKQEFVQAAIASGLPLRSILFRHMLPNGLTPVLVSASFSIASAMNTENVLSFLGIGLVEDPSWGQLIGQATAAGGSFHWWLAIYPGLVLFLTMFSFIIVGENLRDALDPHTQRTSHL